MWRVSCHWLSFGAETGVRYALQESTGSDAEVPFDLEHKVVVYSRRNEEDKHPTRSNTDWYERS